MFVSASSAAVFRWLILHVLVLDHRRSQRRRRAAKLQATVDRQKTPEKEEPAKTVEQPVEEVSVPGPESRAQEQPRMEAPVARKRPAVSATARLSSMYSGQALSRKRVKLGHGAHISVPSSFQVRRLWPLSVVSVGGCAALQTHRAGSVPAG
jgi:hypothetical protein